MDPSFGKDLCRDDWGENMGMKATVRKGGDIWYARCWDYGWEASNWSLAIKRALVLVAFYDADLVTQREMSRKWTEQQRGCIWLA